MKTNRFKPKNWINLAGCQSHATKAAQNVKIGTQSFKMKIKEENSTDSDSKITVFSSKLSIFIPRSSSFWLFDVTCCNFRWLLIGRHKIP